MIGLQNDRLLKWPFNKMTDWQNDQRQNDLSTNWQNDKLTKCQVYRKACWQKADHFSKWPTDKMMVRQNDWLTKCHGTLVGQRFLPDGLLLFLPLQTLAPPVAKVTKHFGVVAPAQDALEFDPSKHFYLSLRLVSKALTCPSLGRNYHQLDRVPALPDKTIWL
jgi:hypothetical protein